MRYPLLVVFLCLALWPAAARAERPLMVVFEVEDPSRIVKPQERTQLTDYLASKMAEGGVYSVVPQDRLRTLMKERKVKSCSEWGCQSAVGWDFKASKVLVAKAMKLGRQCVVTATVFDLKSAASERSANVKGGCSQDALVESIDQVTATLTGRRLPPPVARPAAPTAPGEGRPAPKPAAAKVVRADEPGLASTSQKQAPATDAPKRTAAPAEPEPEPEPPAPRKPWPLWPVLAAAGVGVAGLAVGIPLIALDGRGVDCVGEKRDDNKNCEFLYDTKAPGWAFTSIGIAGAAAAGVFAYFYITTNRDERRSSPFEAMFISPTPEGGAVLGATGRF